MKNFFAQLPYKIGAFMVGRRGMDNFNVALLVASVICMVLEILFAWRVLSWISFVLLIVCCVRCYSKNIAAREKENQKWLAASAKPKRWWNILDTMYVNRKTTKYFRCKGCGQILSIPRGKGTMRIVCPKCKTEVMKKS